MKLFSRVLLKRQSLLTFFVLSYIISWAVWIPLALSSQHSRALLILGGFGPTLSALLLTLITNGRAELRALLKRLLIWRVGIFWYLFGFLGTAIIGLLAMGLHFLLEGAIPEFKDPAQWYLVIPVFLYVLFFSVLGEEIGWRGYALPRLQADHNALAASLIVGVIWGFWHVPLWWMRGNFHQMIRLTLFVAQIVALAILYTWIYNNTQGSLLIAHLFHAASNTTLGVLPILPMDTNGDLRPLWLTVGLLWVFTIAIVALFGSDRLSRKLIAQTGLAAVH